MKTKNELIESWLKKAEKDLKSAKHELSFLDAVTESICFHSQQAVEKFLKAYLLFLDIPILKTHEIGEIINKLEEKDGEISKYKLELDQLTDYAVEIRYPDDYFEPGLEEAKDAFQKAIEVRNYILEKMRLTLF